MLKKLPVQRSHRHISEQKGPEKCLMKRHFQFKSMRPRMATRLHVNSLGAAGSEQAQTMALSQSRDVSNVGISHASDVKQCSGEALRLQHRDEVHRVPNDLLLSCQQVSKGDVGRGCSCMVSRPFVIEWWAQGVNYSSNHMAMSVCQKIEACDFTSLLRNLASVLLTTCSLQASSFALVFSPWPLSSNMT